MSGQDEYFGRLALVVPGGFAGLFLEHDPYPLVPGPPPPETRRIVMLLTDTTKREAALLAVDSAIDARTRDWDVRPGVQPAEWSFVELRAWDRYLRGRPIIRNALAWSFIDARRNRLLYGVWDPSGRDSVERDLAAVGTPCHLVSIEVGTDTGGLGDMEPRSVPWEEPAFHFVRGCPIQPGEPPPGTRVYDLRLHGNFRGPDPRDEVIPLIERMGGRVIHRFNVEVVRAALSARQARFLIRADSSRVMMAIEVLDPANHDVDVHVRYGTFQTLEDFNQLQRHAVRPLSRRTRRFVRAVVPDSNVPRIRELPGVAEVEIGLGTCGGSDYSPSHW